MLPKMSVPTQDPEEWSPAHTQGPTSTMTPFVHRKPDKPRSSGTQFGRDPGRAGTRTFPGTKSRNPPECTNMATRGTVPHLPRDGQGVLAPQARPVPLGRPTLPNTLPQLNKACLPTTRAPIHGSPGDPQCHHAPLPQDTGTSAPHLPLPAGFFLHPLLARIHPSDQLTCRLPRHPCLSHHNSSRGPTTTGPREDSPLSTSTSPSPKAT